MNDTPHIDKEKTSYSTLFFYEVFSKYKFYYILLIMGVILVEISIYYIHQANKITVDAIAQGAAAFGGSSELWKNAIYSGFITQASSTAMLILSYVCFWEVPSIIIGTTTRTYMMRILSGAVIHYPYAFFEKELSGNIVTKINDIEQATNRFSLKFCEEVIRTVAKIAIFLYFLYNIDTGLMWISIIWLCFFASTIALSANKSLSLNKIESDLRGKAAGNISDVLANILSIKIFHKEITEIDRVEKTVNTMNIAKRAAAFFNVRVYLIQDFFLIVYIIVFGYTIATGCVEGAISVGSSVALIGFNSSLMHRMYEFSSKSTDIIVEYSRAKQGLDFFFTDKKMALWDYDFKKLVDCATKTSTPSTELAMTSKNELVALQTQNIEFKNVSFSYNETTDKDNDEKETISNINFIINKGEKIALVGPSGSGKTTIVKLLLKLYNAHSGFIYINGRDIHQIPAVELARLISMVPQDLPVLKRSFRDNLTMSDQNITDAQIWEALDKVNLKTLVSNLPDGLDTAIGESTNLSGGQRQRIAIARVLLTNTPIVVMDEATSQLDTDTEHNIQEIFNAQFKDKIVIIVTHRLYHLDRMNKIIVFNNGKVENIGTHEFLLKSCETYKSFWKN